MRIHHASLASNSLACHARGAIARVTNGLRLGLLAMLCTNLIACSSGNNANDSSGTNATGAGNGQSGANNLGGATHQSGGASYTGGATARGGANLGVGGTAAGGTSSAATGGASLGQGGTGIGGSFGLGGAGPTGAGGQGGAALGGTNAVAGATGGTTSRGSSSAVGSAGNGGASGGASGGSIGTGGALPAGGDRWIIDNTTSIHGYTPTLYGSPTVTSTQQGAALCFDGNDGLLLAKNPVEGLAAFTIEVLMGIDGVTQTALNQPRFLHIETSDANRVTMEARVTQTTYYIDTYLLYGGANRTLADSTKTHPVGQWIWVALTYANGQMAHYVEGVQDASGTVTLSPLGTGQMSLGVRQNLVNYFAGCLREVRVTDSALGASQLQKVTAGAKPPPIRTAPDTPRHWGRATMRQIAPTYLALALDPREFKAFRRDPRSMDQETRNLASRRHLPNLLLDPSQARARRHVDEHYLPRRNLHHDDVRFADASAIRPTLTIRVSDFPRASRG